MTVLITTSSFGAADETPLELLRSHGLEPVLNPLRRKLTEEEALSLIREHAPVGLIAGVEPLTRRVLTAAHGLKVVSRAGIGMDSVDQDAAAELGITVRNTTDAPTQAVAELALCMILSLLRHVRETDASIRRGEWLRSMGNLLAGTEKMRYADLLQMIQEMLHGDVLIDMQPSTRKAHYTLTPYNFSPKPGKKRTANPHIDMGQGLLQCMAEIYEDLGKGPGEA